MFTVHPKSSQAYVRYFYFPASKERPAEVIEVLNSPSETIVVPTREEDLELEAFFERPLSDREAAVYQSDETWKLFASWEELLQDHQGVGLGKEAIEQLTAFRNSPNYTLQGELAA
ncbi:hypothetical protein [Pontibacter mangrovi]|uniref:Uncharacterized protein n=1 Tax=Pontibacter mangrovi TaxID=2589816 RepID=A0A501W443_9BACT|nr:hypothetical protein [Pontibacter mangrovi]TPE44693.1 hypothetical protein FJM65_06600 [Pontibacter mangrovi]